MTEILERPEISRKARALRPLKALKRLKTLGAPAALKPLTVALGNRSRPLLGVDIGAGWVRVVSLDYADRRYRVDDYAVCPLPFDAVIDCHITDVAAVGDAVSQAVAMLDPAHLEAAVAVAGPAVSTTVVMMDAELSEAELEHQILLEAEEHIPYPMEDVVIDFERRPGDGDDGLIEVLLATCRREAVDARVAAVELAGLTVRVVDIEAFVRERLYGLLVEQSGIPAHRPVAFIDLAETAATLTVMQDGRAIHSHEQPVSGHEQPVGSQGWQAGGHERQFSSHERQVSSQGWQVGGHDQRASSREQQTSSHEQEVSGHDRQMSGHRQTVDAQHISETLQHFFASSEYDKVECIFLAGALAGLADGDPSADGSVTGGPSAEGSYVGGSFAGGPSADGSLAGGSVADSSSEDDSAMDDPSADDSAMGDPAADIQAAERIAEQVQALLSTPTRIANPFADFEIGPDIDRAALRRDAPSLLVACGLAMRRAP